ncbi:MAG: peptide-methionine (S)-S-oxide reductase MsrA [Succinivibrio sp.]|nr:peptide-methionine (S)-S-oxide reductase MsrA [Succinivibrio sp.]
MTHAVIYLAGGCFWGVSEYFSRIRGVSRTVCGYAQSKVPNPIYEQVKSGITDAAETVEVSYDPQKISLEVLLQQFFKIIDPLSLDRQGADHGRQYRSGVYYTDKGDLEIIDKVFSLESRKYLKPLCTEKLPLENFYQAEDYHQDYLKKNPGGYCHVDFSSLDDLKEEASDFIDEKKYPIKSRAELKDTLSPKAYAVTVEAGTEAPFTGEYTGHFEPGLYVDVISGAPLFTSDDKFSSACGWPAFAKPVHATVLSRHLDTSLERERIEVRSKTSNAHLGHVFSDGPAERGGLRYCINSAALRFIPYAELDKAGYGEFKKLITKHD